MLLNAGLRKAGSSDTKSSDSLRNHLVRFITTAKRIDSNTPVRYIPIITRALDRAKNAPTNSMYTGILAEQDMNGIISIVRVLSFGLSMDLAAMIAGTLHPKPSSIGTKDLP